MLDFEPVRRGERTIADLAAGLTTADLAALTEEMGALELAILEGAVDADVVFVPDDPEANDTFAADQGDVGLAWTLGHVVVHATASSEEAAALALNQARGLPYPGRSRIEVPWQEVTSAAFCRSRLAESRRMRLAMLAAWPDVPALDNLYPPYPGQPPRDAVATFLGGLVHEDSHLGQMRSALAQSRTARGPA